jgi:sugar lactone lactonase YvrE
MSVLMAALSGVVLTLALAGCAALSVTHTFLDAAARGSNAAMLPASHADDCASEPCIYVSSFSGEAAYLFSPDGKDNTRAKLIYGRSTGLEDPSGIALDAGRNIYIADQEANGVFVFAPGVIGNVRPTRTISGDATGIARPEGITLDQKGRLYVANQGQNYVPPSVATFAAGSNGNVAPTQLISGNSTGLVRPLDVAIGPDGDEYVADFGNSGETINVYAPHADGNVAPLRAIGGSNTLIFDAASIAVDTTGELYVANAGQSGGAAILVFAPGASGNVAPSRSISGGQTLLNPAGLALDGDFVYAVNQARYEMGYITVYPKTASGGVAPTKVIKTHPAFGLAQFLVVR